MESNNISDSAREPREQREQAEINAAVTFALKQETKPETELCFFYEWLMKREFAPEDITYKEMKKHGILPGAYAAEKLRELGRLKGTHLRLTEENRISDVELDTRRQELERKIRRRNELMREYDWDKDYSGIFKTRSLYDTLVDSSKRPDPEYLWKSLWVEGELCCLFADTNVGKSIYAIQIAQHIAKSRKILVFDFELNDKQLEKRGRDKNNNIYQFHKNLLRTRIDLSQLDPEDALEDVIITSIEQECTFEEVDTLIIDNIGWLTTNAADGEVAARLLQKLLDLRDRRGFSMLVIGHTNKRDLKLPLTQNDLSGSKKLMNYFDAAFCIGCGVADPTMRYVKQIKTRNGEFVNGEDNVIVCEISDEGGWAHFEERGFMAEEKMLRTPSENDARVLKERILRLHDNEHKSIRSIAKELRLSFSKVQRIIARSGAREQGSMPGEDSVDSE